MKPEYHLFIIWQNARYKESEILNDITQEFEILYKINTRWTKEYFSSNLTRFYGTNLPPNSGKEQHIGIGDFLVIIVKDTKSIYNHHETSKGKKYINSHTFLAKTKYRDLTGGGHKIHGTNTPLEFTHDFALLFGCSIDDFMKRTSPSSLKTIEHRDDLVGFNGWSNLRQVFRILELSDTYVVLRNFESLPDDFDTKHQGDIDILSKNNKQTAYILNASRISPLGIGVQHSIDIGDDKVLFDIYDLEDGHYDKAWKKKILESRNINKKGISIIGNPDLYKYNLLYQNLIHKQVVPQKYISVLTDMGLEMTPGREDEILKELGLYLARNKYEITRSYPVEFFNQKNVDAVEEYMREYREELQISRLIKMYKFNSVERFESVQKDERRFYKATRDNKTFFVKTSSFSYENEFYFTKKMYDANKNLFAKPIEFKNGETNSFVAKWVDGVQLDEYIKDKNITSDQKECLINDLVTIANVLWQERIVHRDLIPRNFMVTKTGNLILIDFYWAVDLDTYHEYDYIEKNIEYIRFLGEDFSPREYKWDDSYSFIKIAEYIMGKDTIKNNPDIEKIKSRIGERVIKPDGTIFQTIIDKQRLQIDETLQYNTELNEDMVKKDQKIIEKETQIQEKDNHIRNILNSKSYRIGRFVAMPAKVLRKVIDRVI